MGADGGPPATSLLQRRPQFTALREAANASVLFPECRARLLEPAAAGDAGWQLDKKYQLRVTFIGSRFVAVCSDPEDYPTFETKSEYRDSRRGAFSMSIPKGAELEISKLRIKVLR